MYITIGIDPIRREPLIFILPRRAEHLFTSRSATMPMFTVMSQGITMAAKHFNAQAGKVSHARICSKIIKLQGANRMNLKGHSRRAFYPALMLAQSRDSTAAFQPIRRAIHQNAGARTAGKISGGHNMYNYVNNMYICCIKWVKKRHCTAKINIYKSSKMLEFARQSML